MYLFTSPNSLSTDNYIYKYWITQAYSGSKTSDVIITKMPTNINVKSNQITTLAVSQNFLGYGCESCNTYSGLIVIYNQTSFAQITTVAGSQSDNP